jgi:hypothetical protein
MKQNSLNLESLENNSLDQIKQLIEKFARPASEILLDDVDLRNLLKVSRRTALEYRKRKIFPFYKIDNKIYYILSEVISGIKEKRGNHGD